MNHQICFKDIETFYRKPLSFLHCSYSKIFFLYSMFLHQYLGMTLFPTPETCEFRNFPPIRSIIDGGGGQSGQHYAKKFLGWSTLKTHARTLFEQTILGLENWRTGGCAFLSGWTWPRLSLPVPNLRLEQQGTNTLYVGCLSHVIPNHQKHPRQLQEASKPQEMDPFLIDIEVWM